MQKYVHLLPALPAFQGKGLFGYSFDSLKQKDLDVYYVDVEKGHDFFMVSKNITRTYYVLEGNGYFTIDDTKYDIDQGMLVEVPPKVEYCYSGKMKLLVFSKPRWSKRNDRFTKWNPDVIAWRVEPALDRESMITRLIRIRILGKSPTSAYLRLNRALWTKLPNNITSRGPARAYGGFLHRLARAQGAREQSHATFFLRNRPQLELIGRLLEQSIRGDTVRVAVLGCSTGAEVYSIARTIRSARPDVNLVLDAVDISEDAVKVGECGVYFHGRSRLTDTNVFERMTEPEMEEFFDINGDAVTIKSSIRQGIKWRVGDVGKPGLREMLGHRDLVIANNFLCHMNVSAAERCLHNIAELLRPGGYLFVSGVDLDIRTKVARDLQWSPLEDLLEEIHEGDSCMGAIWPFQYAGVEPLNKHRPDWKLRYAAAFRLGVPSEPDRNPTKINTPIAVPALGS